MVIIEVMMVMIVGTMVNEMVVIVLTTIPLQVTAENRLGSETHSLELVVHGEFISSCTIVHERAGFFHDSQGVVDVDEGSPYTLPF